MTQERSIYTTTARARAGQVKVEGTGETLPVALPTALGGANAWEGWSPEQLHAAALASCMQQSLALAASVRGLSVENSSVTADVSLEHSGPLRYAFQASMRIDLPDLEAGEYQNLIAEAARACPMASGVHIDGL
ncbi:MULTISPECIES: OsmC family protein [Streptomyces]|nr:MULTISPECIES: OsmC family protein [Streptomyces]